MNLAGGLARLLARVRAVEFIEGIEHRVLCLGPGPPHGHRSGPQAVGKRLVDDRSVGRTPQGDDNGRGALDGNRFLPALQIHPVPLVLHLVRIGGVDLLCDQVQVIVLEHGQAPAELPVVSQQCHRIEGLVMAVELEAGGLEMGLVPN